MSSLEVLFTPADFAGLAQRDLTGTSCVVFDVLRATSTMVTAFWNGAEAIIPVQEIGEALAVRQQRPGVLLAGERDGLRIGPDLAGGVTFDLGNSPREFTRENIAERTIVMTTTNGTRALRACANARSTVIGSFLNLSATAQAIHSSNPGQLLLVCSGTLDQAAYEDVLGAGALCDLLWARYGEGLVSDSARMARDLFRQSRNDLSGAVSQARNARRLLSKPELEADVAFCLRCDSFPLVASLAHDGLLRRNTP
jgi:2-phosphosulfolactate phosphatase